MPREWKSGIVDCLDGGALNCELNMHSCTPLGIPGRTVCNFVRIKHNFCKTISLPRLVQF